MTKENGSVQVGLRIDARMSNALKDLASKWETSVSSIIKRSIREFLEKQGIDYETYPSEE
jgi:predicted transcriptional regulator